MLTTLRTTRWPASAVGLGERADHRLRGAQDAKRRRQVAVDHRVPLLVGHLLDHVVPGVAGVVDDDVEALVFADGRADEALGEVRRGDAADAGHGLAAGVADGLHGLLRRFGVEIVDDDARAFAGELERDRAADAAARTGDEGDLAVEFACHGAVLLNGLAKGSRQRDERFADDLGLSELVGARAARCARSARRPARASRPRGRCSASRCPGG